MEEVSYRGYTIVIKYEEVPMNPRTDWDNLGTIFYTSTKYQLGDKYKEPDEINEMIKSNQYLYLMVYAYIHSGIALWTSLDSKMGLVPPSHRGWDTMTVGIVAVEKEKVRKENNVKRISPKLKAQVYRILNGEVETYSHYCNGNVYGYEIHNPQGDEIDSCWGFFGCDHKGSGLLEHAQNAIDCAISWAIKAHIARAKTWIKNRVPLMYRRELIF